MPNKSSQSSIKLSNKVSRVERSERVKDFNYSQDMKEFGSVKKNESKQLRDKKWKGPRDKAGVPIYGSEKGGVYVKPRVVTGNKPGLQPGFLDGRVTTIPIAKRKLDLQYEANPYNSDSDIKKKMTPKLT